MNSFKEKYQNQLIKKLKSENDNLKRQNELLKRKIIENNKMIEKNTGNSLEMACNLNEFKSAISALNNERENYRNAVNEFSAMKKRYEHEIKKVLTEIKKNKRRW